MGKVVMRWPDVCSVISVEALTEAAKVNTETVEK